MCISFLLHFTFVISSKLFINDTNLLLKRMNILFDFKNYSLLLLFINKINIRKMSNIDRYYICILYIILVYG